MGICNSVFTSDPKIQEINENHLIETHRRRNEMRLKQSAKTPEVSTSIYMMDIESSNELLSSSSSSSTLSETESDVFLPQEDPEALVICGKALQAREEVREVYVPKVEGKSWKKTFLLRSKKERQLQKNKKSEIKSASKSVSAVPPVHVRHFSYSGPPPRPSPWKEVYLTMIKPNEQMAEQSLKKNEKVDKIQEKHVNRKEQFSAKAINSTKGKTSSFHCCDTPQDRATEQNKTSEPDDDSVLSDGKSSSSLHPTSTRSYPRTSRDTFIISNDSSEESFSSVNCYYKRDDESSVIGAHGDMILSRSLDNGKDVGKKSRKSFRRKRSKVSPM